MTKKEADKTMKIQRNERDDDEDDDQFEPETKSYSRKKQDTNSRQEPARNGKKNSTTGQKSVFARLVRRHATWGVVTQWSVVAKW